MVLEVGVAVDMSLPPLRNGDPYHFLINRLVVGIDQLDEDRVRPWREAIDDDGIAAGVGPVPCGVVDRHVNVSNLWSYGERRRSEYRHDESVPRRSFEERTTISGRPSVSARRVASPRIWRGMRTTGLMSSTGSSSSSLDPKSASRGSGRSFTLRTGRCMRR